MQSKLIEWITYNCNMPKPNDYQLSVVVPIGNLGGNISELESWVPNDPRIEIILILDTEDIDTKSSIKNSRKINSIINKVIIEASFGNPGDARNLGMLHARGSWISFVDADDVLKVHELMEVIETHDEIGKNVIVGNYEVLNLKTKKNRSVNYFELDDLLSSLPSGLGLWRFTFRREYLNAKGVKFPNISMAEDQVFYLGLQPSSREIIFCIKSLYRYTLGGEHQLTSNPLKIGDLKKAIPLSMNLINPNERKYFDFLSAQIYSLLLNKTNSPLISKLKYILFILKGILLKFGLSGLQQVITYPLRRCT